MKILAIWGAILSTALAAIRTYEIRKGSLRKFQIAVEEDSQAQITTFSIINQSTNPLNIYYYDVFFAKNRFSREKNVINIYTGLEGSSSKIHIKPHETCDLEFSEDRYFNLYAKKYEGKNLYMKIFLRGRKRPVIKKVA